MPDENDTSGPAPEGAPDTNDAEPGQPAAPQAENRRARRAAAATSRKKGGVPARPQRPGYPGGGLDASERVDDAFARAADGSARWVKNHFNIVQWLIVAGVAGWIGWQIYSWRADRTATKVSGLIAEAMAADLGKVGAPDEEGKRDAHGSLDTRRVFSSDQDRLKAARAQYEKVIQEHPNTKAASLAQLGLAGVAYDEGKYDEANKLYGEVTSSELAKIDPESRGRALEGSGLSLEAKGDREGALKRYHELENAEISGFRELALYHQARVLHAKGDDEGAKDRLKKVLDKLKKEDSAASGPSYLVESAKDLLQRIDPKAVPPPSSDEQLRKAIEEFQKKLPAGVSRVPMPVPTGP